MSGELGATYLGGGRCRFLLWAPRAERVELRVVAPQERLAALEKGERGYHHATLDGVEPGASYLYRLDGNKERPDPASRFQPDVHAPSEVVDPGSFMWNDKDWTGIPLEQYTLYELHVGTFTPEGTFDAVIPHLDDLQDLGITAIEIMPVAQFPGSRNWGYDGVYPFAVQASYGGPQGLQRLSDACHQRGMALVLDVVYNHLGPEGNYLADYGPYFTERYRTPWGMAINFDGAGSDEVRRFFIENALHWVTEFHIDALRLDAIHGIVDMSATPFLAELADALHQRARELGRRIYLIPESDLNDARVVLPRETGGHALDAQWNDDFHHSLRVLLTGERTGYYRDFGSAGQLAAAHSDGYVYSGQYSEFRRRRHGNPSRKIAAHQLVVFSQNHDQVGNRMMGERLSRQVPWENLKLAAGTVILSPFLPLLFMGEEHGETAPFLYFISHSDPGLVEAVRNGRKQEFAAFDWQGEPPDPQAESTFHRSRLDWTLPGREPHRTLREFYRELFRLRRELPALATPSKDRTEAVAIEEQKVLFVRRWNGDKEAFGVLHFGDIPAAVSLPVPSGEWIKQLDSAGDRWQGPGSSLPESFRSEGQAALRLSPHSLALYSRREEV